MICNLEQNIVDICHKDYKFFFCKPNVQGIALGYKYTKGFNTLEPCIHVFVTKKLSSNCLIPNGLIPPYYKEIKTDVIQTGELTGGNIPEITHYNYCSTLDSSNDGPYIRRIRPISPGYCMSIDTTTIANPLTGTLGYIVTDNLQVSKTYCLLSVNKTFANINKAPIGKPIIQPSYNYGGRAPNDIVANLLRFQFINFSPDMPKSIQEFNRIDASIASYNNEQQIQLIDPHIPGIGIPRGIVYPARNQPVQWTGCISGHNTSVITSLSATIKIRYQNNQFAWFKDVFIASGKCEFQDYGSLVCDMKGNAIGLNFATNQVERILVISDINYIQTDLNVKLLTL